MRTRNHADTEITAELRAWVDLLTEEKMKSGLSHEEARRAALIETGGIEQVSEQVRDVRRGAVLGTLLQDVRYALRRIRREPAFFLFATLIIGLGVGANTAVYSVLSPLLLRPLPFADADRLVWVAQSEGVGLSAVTSRTSNLRDYRELNRSFEGLTGYFAFFDYERYNLSGDGAPERLVGVGVARDFLEVLGVEPALGRNFVEEEAVWNGRPAVILTHAFWTRRFNADRGMIGRTLTLNGEPTTVVGVLPRSFDFASTFTPASHVDFLRPFPIADETDAWGNTLAIIGRLRPGVTIESAQAELDDINRRLSEADAGRWGLGAMASSLRDHIAGEFRTALLLLIAAAGVVLLVACANLSNLLLARGRRRSREMAVRSALGASRPRLFRQLAIESLVLALCGGLAGVIIAVLVTRSVTRAGAIPIPLLDTIAVDAHALLFTLAVTLLAGVLLGLAPIVQLAGGRPATALNDSSRGSTEGRRGAAVRDILVVAEVALACVLLVGGGLLLCSFARVLDTELGFEPRGAVAWRVDTDRDFDTREEAVAFYEELITAVAAMPGVEAAALTDTPPLGRNRGWVIRAKGVVYGDGEVPGVFPRMVDSRYLEVMRIPLLAGRYFTAHDNARSGNVVILNETAARTLFPGQDAIGRTAVIFEADWQVVGVVSDVRHQSLEQESGLEMYLPIAQSPDYLGLTMVVRSGLPLARLVAGVRNAIQSVDPAMPTGDYEALESVVDRAVSPRRFILLVLGGFAGAALLLAVLGIYAVVSYSVSQRIPEIGIRMALGESGASVQRAVVTRTLLLAATGIVIGAALSFIASRLMQSLLYGVGPTDRITFAGMATVLLIAAALAGYLPARRASRVDPAVALRST
jgi:putative ABC transport system permease protein